MDPKVSVIIVTFNAAKHVRKAIESFLAQTFISKELIIIDAASTDETIDIIREFHFENIRFVSEPDRGIYDAMNKGVRMARGEWLYFLGSDDYFLSNGILSEVFSQHLTGIDIVYGNVYSELLQRKYDGPTSKEKLLFSNLCHQSIFYRKEVFEIAGFYNLEYKLFADWEFNIRCFIHFQLEAKYIPILIAYFSAKGISTTDKDLNFLRNYLFPENLKYLNDVGIHRMNDIKYYDRWWRLLRSMRMADGKVALHDLANNIPVPESIEKMFRFQNRFPQKIVFIGVFSKILMSICYLFNR